MTSTVQRPPTSAVPGYPPASSRSVNPGTPLLPTISPEVPTVRKAAEKDCAGELEVSIDLKQLPETDDGDSTNDGSSPEGKSDSSPSQPGQNNLIVNYLPSHITEPDLRNIFAGHGTLLHVKVVYDRSTGKSMGYGFVKYATDEEAAAATAATNGLQIAKKRIKVSVARPSSKDIKNSKLYVTNLPDNFTQDDVIQAFEQFGKIIECRTLVDRKTGLSRCTAFVQFDTRREAKHALKYMHGGNLSGAKKPLLVKFAEDHHRRLQRHAQPKGAVIDQPQVGLPQFMPYAAPIRPVKGGGKGGHKGRSGTGGGLYRGDVMVQMPPGHAPGATHMGTGYMPHSMGVPGSSGEGTDPSSLGQQQQQSMVGRYAMANHSNAAAAAAAYGAAAAAAQGGYNMMGLNNALAMMSVNGAGYAMPSSPMMRGGQGQGILPQMQVPPAYANTGNGGINYGTMGNGIPQPHPAGPMTPEITQQGGVVPSLERGTPNNPFALRM
ncbi:unnamed protein product [Choristocarpus tenellus]